MFTVLKTRNKRAKKQKTLFSYSNPDGLTISLGILKSNLTTFRMH